MRSAMKKKKLIRKQGGLEELGPGEGVGVCDL